ncbi:hypothetical protein T4D_801, partial [Trichinella pseudospiralis]
LLKVVKLTFSYNSMCHFPNTNEQYLYFEKYSNGIYTLNFEEVLIILPKLISKKTMQCSASHHTFPQENSAN